MYQSSLGAIVKKGKLFLDSRGFFVDFGRQINPIVLEKKMSFSKPFVFRGLHQQRGLATQEKELHVAQGEILDFVYDQSKNELEVHYLKTGDKIFIPKFCYHGFYTFTETTVIYDIGGSSYHKDQEISLSVQQDVFERVGDFFGKFVYPQLMSEKDLQSEMIPEDVLIRVYDRNNGNDSTTK